MTSTGSAAEHTRAGGRRLKICLAASGGGHLRQLLEMRRVRANYDCVFVTEDTALGQSVARETRTFFVPHFALGQGRLQGWGKWAVAAVSNASASFKFVLKERPDVVVTTGAGAVFFTVLFAKLFGARVVTVESFARFHTPSLFGRLAAPFAARKAVQSHALLSAWPDAAAFDPFRVLDEPRPVKEPLVFATVGAILPFDRLVALVGAAKARGELPEHVLVQTGLGGVRPDGVECVETLPFDQINETLSRADLVICHGGTGSIVTALKAGCRVVAVPRLPAHGEVYDDHQAEICAALRDRGLIEVANTDEEMTRALAVVRSREPTMCTTDSSELEAWLASLFDGWSLPPAAAVRAGSAEPPMADGDVRA